MRDSAMQNAPTILPTQDFQFFLKQYLGQALLPLGQENFELFRVIISEILVNEELRQLYAEKILNPTLVFAEPLFQMWVEQGIIKQVNTPLIVSLISSFIMGAILQNIMGNTILKENWDTLPDLLSEMLFTALKTNP
jgi:hypothetical protein